MRTILLYLLKLNTRNEAFPLPKPTETHQDFINRFCQELKAVANYPDIIERIYQANQVWNKHQAFITFNKIKNGRK